MLFEIQVLGEDESVRLLNIILGRENNERLCKIKQKVCDTAYECYTFRGLKN